MVESSKAMICEAVQILGTKDTKAMAEYYHLSQQGNSQSFSASHVANIRLRATPAETFGAVVAKNETFSKRRVHCVRVQRDDQDDAGTVHSIKQSSLRDGRHE